MALGNIQVIEMAARGEGSSGYDDDQLLNLEQMREENKKAQQDRKAAQEEARNLYYARLIVARMQMYDRLAKRSSPRKQRAPRRVEVRVEQKGPEKTEFSFRPAVSSPVTAAVTQAKPQVIVEPAKTRAQRGEPSVKTQRIVRNVALGIVIAGVIGAICAVCIPAGIVVAAVILLGVYCYRKHQEAKVQAASRKDSWVFAAKPESQPESAQVVVRV